MLLIWLLESGNMFCLFQCSQWEFSSQLYIELFATLFVLDWCCPVVLCSVTLLSLWRMELPVKSYDTLHLHSIPSVQYQWLALLWRHYAPQMGNPMNSLRDKYPSQLSVHYNNCKSLSHICVWFIFLVFFLNCKANAVYFLLYLLGKILNYLWIIMYFRLLHSFDMCQIAILCCCIFWNL